MSPATSRGHSGVFPGTCKVKSPGISIFEILKSRFKVDLKSNLGLGRCVKSETGAAPQFQGPARSVPGPPSSGPGQSLEYVLVLGRPPETPQELLGDPPGILQESPGAARDPRSGPGVSARQFRGSSQQPRHADEPESGSEIVPGFMKDRAGPELWRGWLKRTGNVETMSLS